MSAKASPMRVALAGCATLALAMGIGRFVFTPILPMMRDDGLLTVSEGGLLASAHFLGYLIGAVSAAWITISPRLLMRLSLIAIAAATLAMGLETGYGVWLVLRWLAGLCSAWVLILVGNYYVKHLAVHGRPQHQSWVFAGVGAGIAAAGLGVLGLTVAHVGSSVAWQTIGALSLAVALALSWKMGPELPERAAGGRDFGTARARFDWNAIAAYGAAGLGYIIPATYLPLMARELVSSPWIFGAVWPVFGVAALISTLLAAWLHRHFSNRVVWCGCQLVMAAGVLLPAFLPHIAAIAVSGLCVGGTFIIITMAGFSEMHRLMPAGTVGTHIAAMTAAFALGQMIGPGLAGMLYDLSGNFNGALMLTGIILALTAVLLVALPQRGGVADEQS